MKRCTVCGESKSPDAFASRVQGRAGLRAECRACTAAKQRERDVARFAARDAEREARLAEFESMAPFGGAAERAAVEEFAARGTMLATATALGITLSALRSLFSNLERRAARRGWAPESDLTKPTPAGYHVKGVSTLYGAEGEVKQQWVKTNVDAEDRLAMLADAVREIAEPFRGAADPTKPPKARDEDLLCVIPFGDPHLGLHAWREEAGENFDLKIAEADLISAVDMLLDVAPPSKECLIVTLGDTFHSDSNAGTTTHGTRVDVDTRWSKVLSVGIRAMRRCIDRALEKHEHVTFVPVCGNHDEHTGVVLGLCLAQYYEREPRVTIDTSPAPFHWFRFGKNLLGMTHGDKVKKEQLPGIMACDRKQDWSETEHRVFLSGHIHHETVKEFPGVTVRSYRTLAPRDAWHNAAGYRSGRDLHLEIYHREDGPMGGHVVNIDQVRRRRVRCRAL
jgi:hypothetical protein